MGDLYEILCVTAIAGWVLSRPLIWFLPPPVGALVGLGTAVLLSLLGAIWPISNWPVALFSPVSLGIAALALADLLRPFGVIARRWSMVELTGILVLYVAYLYASLGGIAYDPYALGYTAGASLIIPGVLAAVALGRKDWLLGGTIAAAQTLWIAGIGSENLYDHLVSLLLIPAVLIGMLRRFRGR